MKRIGTTLVMIVLVASLGGCASWIHAAVKYTIGDSPYTRDAVTAVAITMQAYDTGIQPQIEAYGDWPKEGTAACRAMGSSLLCRDQETWDRLKKYNQHAQDAIDKATLIIEGVVPDTDGTALSEATKAIHAAEGEFLTNATPKVVP